ncbi:MULTISPECIES: hypothetical protein [unclassified Vibrio]|uniref:hypothetical protein n=1 Tax=unclassified Vibrio TaxID=2614977 RepID=UPI002108B374|nr:MULTISPECIES: hypothetical protein [unclassified Vibrio]
MNKDLWEGRSLHGIEHVTELFENSVLGAFMSGHLVLESILVQMLESNSTDADNGRYFEWSFRRKVDASENRGIINQNTAEFLRGVNYIRNRLSHKLGTRITFDEAFNLAGLAAAGGVDFSDSTIYLDKSRSFYEYGIEGVIQEVFQNAAQDLLYLLDDESFLENFVSARNS